MKRIAIIGCGGAGKSVLAREVGRRTGIPVVHLDALYWSAEWEGRPKDKWEALHGRLVDRETWILDGNYGGTMDMRLAAADTVVFLDLPTRTCLRRVLFRRARGLFRPPRPDLGLPDRVTLDFLRWIAGYRRTRRPRILERLAALDDGTRVVILTREVEVRAFLAEIPN